MNHSLVFQIVNTIALFSWILLLVFPNAKPTKKLIRNGLMCILMSITYLIFAIIAMSSGAEGGLTSLEAVMKGFESKDWVLTGWIHYLAFDLFLGIWIKKDSEKKGIHHFIIIPSLVFTFLMGPIGFLIYYFTRYLQTKTVKAFP